VSAERASGPGVRRALLLVEDDEGIRDALCELFEHVGFRVVPATTLAAARREYARERFDAIILDFHLPDGDAPALLDALGPSRAPTVLLSAGPEAPAAAHASGLPFLAKPFDAEELIAVVTALVSPAAGTGGAAG